MAAITKRLLHFRPIPRPDPYNPRYFSSSSSDNPAPESEPESEKSPPKTQPSFSSYMNDVKSSLQREPNPQNRLRKPLSFANPKPPPLTPPPPSKDASISEIRRNLNEYRIRSAPPPPSSGQFVSFQELYKKNVISNPSDGAVKPPSSNLIRDSLRQMRPAAPYVKNQNVDPASLTRFKESLKLKPDSDSPKIGDSLPSSIFGKGSEEEGSAVGMRTAFLNSYKYPDLGEKLKMLRPEKKKGNWFSLQELNDRLARLKEIEADENHSNIKVVAFKDLRDSIVKLKLSEDEKNREKTMQRLEVLGQLGGTPSFMLLPPKGDLVDKYFHPDNMSSAEKLKLELKKVRDEFKMSESDCGSARVQVAQLTTKIKHLSTVLLKKDKHSRKGLQGMVQRRKKLLKYLRRTDWDSYCLVLSKLGLRDNPDAKA